MARKFKLSKLRWSKQKSSKDVVAANDDDDKITAAPADRKVPPIPKPRERIKSAPPAIHFDHTKEKARADVEERYHRHSFRRLVRRRRARSFSEPGSAPVAAVVEQPGVISNPPDFLRGATSDDVVESEAVVEAEAEADDGTVLVERSAVGDDTCGRAMGHSAEGLRPLVRSLSSSALSWSEGVAEVGETVCDYIADSTDNVMTKFLYFEDYVGGQIFDERGTADSLDGDSISSVSKDSNSLVDKTCETSSSDESSVQEIIPSTKEEIATSRVQMIQDVEVFDPQTSKMVKKKVFVC